MSKKINKRKLPTSIEDLQCAAKSLERYSAVALDAIKKMKTLGLETCDVSGLRMLKRSNQAIESFLSNLSKELWLHEFNSRKARNGPT